MITSRYVHETTTSNNGQGIASSTFTGELDSNCVKTWSRADCERMAERQNVTGTLLSELASLGYELFRSVRPWGWRAGCVQHDDGGWVPWRAEPQHSGPRSWDLGQPEGRGRETVRAPLNQE